MVTHESNARELLGERVRIRPWRRADTLIQERWPRYSEPFSSLWNIPRPYQPGQDDQDWTGATEAWAVELRSGSLIGRISLREIDRRRQSARLGISLAQPYVGQGLGGESLRLFLSYYFGALGYQRMVLDVAAFNRRAVRCYQRLGFVSIGSEWRPVGNEPALRLLDDEQYQHLRSYFRRNPFNAHVEFYEMELTREAWLAAGGGLIE
ncbi:MAG: N-acetyltransferase [Chloroflexus sp.]|uniref:GNAT family N-acetyltransferase n=1 Tax=Chloroflexus sp. TaxID=1904827 RepID=UPI0021DBF9F4|nr:GNAT family N-acetyltransferase [Chloroflexus sp.]GIV90670.1 MAG: N-acetyltransferase [Chloroflexus sp.]